MTESKKQNICNLIKVMVFLVIISIFFLMFTYLFRPLGSTSRAIILDYYEEETELDMVFIGASAVICYWNPMLAWEEQGIATRNYASEDMNRATHLSALKDVLETQQPELVVIEARRFLREGKMPGVRKQLDSMDYDWARMKAIHYFCNMRGVSWENSIPLYIDLIQYHDNYEALVTAESWKVADNRLGDVPVDTYKGYGLYSRHASFENPTGHLSDECDELDDEALRCYVDIIEYCQENDIQLLFVAAPLVITEWESRQMNTLAQVADSYGVEFLDMNRYYEELGLDFSVDFFNARHVNILGADKYTSYLAEYIAETYDLPDHRGEPEYASWDELYQTYSVKAEEARETCRENILANQESVSGGDALSGNEG